MKVCCLQKIEPLVLTTIKQKTFQMETFYEWLFLIKEKHSSVVNFNVKIWYYGEMNLQYICSERREHGWVIRQSFGSYFHLGCCFALLTLSFGSSNVELTQCWNACMHGLTSFLPYLLVLQSFVPSIFNTNPPSNDDDGGTLRSSSSKTVGRIRTVVVGVVVVVGVMLIGEWLCYEVW